MRTVWLLSLTMVVLIASLTVPQASTRTQNPTTLNPGELNPLANLQTLPRKANSSSAENRMNSTV